MKVVILTGAGVSAESGLETFRGADGLWSGYRLDQLATKQAFGADPGRVNSFYNMRRRKLVGVEPNEAHLALARLEDALKEDFLLITQNVDDLHERAGSRRLIHLHGELRMMRCTWCEAKFECEGDIDSLASCQECGRNQGLRPDVVWFGEEPYELETAYRALEEADWFVAIGTSGVVEPASRFATRASVYGARTVQLNLEENERSGEFDEVKIGPATAKVPEIVDMLVARLI